ncbi:ABC transporter permease [Amycolatopsis suaedae]|uniref:ABC transporter permease n=1 Tax=Amycolatopsis suaedae TaxID=2510978 RepID=A0A4Q7IWY6_9PSEU|nr:ABC transporter permease [Amycolatopsis suaedae]RZQ59451.1 ABC transporter permease [Amycolatopsis suaedae]
MERRPPRGALARAMLRDLAAHRSRVAMTLAAITLGVAAVVAGWSVGDSAVTTVTHQELRTLDGVSVRRAENGTPLTAAEVDRIADAAGGGTVTTVLSGYAGVVGADGRLVASPTPIDRAGTGWDTTGRFLLTAGRAPAGPGEVALSRAQAEAVGATAGTKVPVLLAGGRRENPVVAGIYEYRTVDAELDPTPAIAYDAAAAADRFGPGAERIELATPGADATAAARAITAITGADREVRTGPELTTAARQEQESARDDLRWAVLPFAAVTLLAGMFVIANTFSMLVGQRIRQLALLRAVGARRSQVRRAVFTEALALALVGGTTGVLAGLALGPAAQAALGTGDVEFVVSPAAIGLGYAVAVVVTLAAALGSAQRAASVPPVAALRDDARPDRPLGRRSAVGVAVLAAGIGTVALTSDPAAPNLVRITTLIGAVVAAAGVLLLAPWLASVVLRPLVRLTGRRGGPALRLGLRNAARDPRRTAGTAAAITIGLGLVCAFATLSSTLETLISSTVRATVPLTSTVVVPSANGAKLTAADVTAARSAPGVGTVAPVSEMLAEVGHPGGTARRNVSVIDPGALGTLVTPDVTAGVGDLRKGVVVARNQADMLGLSPGAAITLTLGSRPPVHTTVAGVYEATEYSASIYLDAALAPEVANTGITHVYASGTDPAAARQGIERAFAGRPDVRVTDRDGMAAEYVERQRVGFTVMSVMFGVAVVVAVFGVVNTLALSVLERRREIGVLRAVGANRALVRRVIRVESLVMSLFGALLGVLTGLGTGAVMQGVMLGQELSTTTFPLDTVALAMAGIVVAAVAAALWPARQAARTDVLTAVAAP